MNILHGLRVVESVLLVEDGEPCKGWFPLGRSGWKAERMYVPKIPYRGAVQLNATTLVMHPATLRLVRELAAKEQA